MNLKDNKGITGVDVAVATVILIVFVSLVAGLFYNLSSTSKSIERKSTATNLAIEVIEALKITDFTVLYEYEAVQKEMTSEELETLTGKTIEIPNGYTVAISITNPETDGEEDLTMGEYVKIVTSEVSYLTSKDLNNDGYKDVETIKIETLVKNITGDTSNTIVASETIYTALYTDGTLVLSTSEDNISAETVSKNYGNIAGQTYATASEIPWYEDRESITTVNFDDEIVPTDTSYWFYECTQLTAFENMQNLNTSQVTSMSAMFGECTSLTTLDVTNFNTENVTDMNNMFYYCTSLASLDVSSFDTSNVTNMTSMFGNCNTLTSLNVSNFDTTNVTNMTNMFLRCSNIITLDLSMFDTPNLTAMTHMFDGCTNLKSVDVSKFNTSKITSMSSIFYNCTSLESVDVSNFDTSNVVKLASMFGGCYSLKSIDVSNFKTSKVTNMANMFDNCQSLVSIDLSNFETSNVTDMTSVFWQCFALESVNVSNFNTEKVTTMQNMFGRCTQLTTLDLTSFNTSSVTNMAGMFSGDTNLTAIYATNGKWVTIQADTTSMFSSCGVSAVTM